MIFKIRECSLQGLTTLSACVRVTVASGCVYTRCRDCPHWTGRHQQAGPWPRVVTGAHSGHSQSGADTGTTARVTHRDNNKDNRRHPNKITQHGDQSQESDDRVSRAEMTCSK